VIRVYIERKVMKCFRHQEMNRIVTERMLKGECVCLSEKVILV